MDPMDQRHVALWTPYIYPGCMKYTIHISKTHCGKSRVTIEMVYLEWDGWLWVRLGEAVGKDWHVIARLSLVDI